MKKTKGKLSREKVLEKRGSFWLVRKDFEYPEGSQQRFRTILTVRRVCKCGNYTEMKTSLDLDMIFPFRDWVLSDAPFTCKDCQGKGRRAYMREYMRKRRSTK